MTDKNRQEIEEKYKVFLKRKDWKELTENEKILFEWFERNLNGDVSASALLAVDLYEKIISELIKRREREAVEGFVEWVDREENRGYEATIRLEQGYKYLKYLSQQKENK